MYTNYPEDENTKNPFYIGTVVDNKDPTRNYRIKVRLPKIHKNIKDDDLPWAARVDRAFRGIESNTPDPNKSTNNQSSGDNKKSQNQEKKKEEKQPPKFDHCVPEVGTKVLVLAIQNDVNSLVYLGALYKKTDYTPEDEEKYLKTYGIYSNKEQFIGMDCTNKEDNEIKVHFIGHVNVDKVKKITVNAEQEIVVTGKRDIKIEILNANKSDSKETNAKSDKNNNSSDEVNVTIINNRGTVKVQSKKLVAEVKEDAIIKSKTLTATVEEKAELTCKELNCNATEKAIIKTQDLTCNADKNLTVTSPNIKLNGSVEINGKTTINGNLKVSGNIDSDNSINAKTGVNAGNIPLGAHSHTYYTDGSPSSTVNTFPTPS